MIKDWIPNAKSFFVECKRVFKLTKRPTKEEFKVIVKASGLGIIIIGIIGFLIFILGDML